MFRGSFAVLMLVCLVSIAAIGVSHTDSIPPYQYDSGVRARSSGDLLFGQCDLRFATEPISPISTDRLYYSTDGQASWNYIDATLESGDRYTAETGSIAGDANWRFYFEGDEAWAGQTPVYSGSSTCRLTPNWYVNWDDTPGLDSTTAYLPGSGDWLDIIGAGFAMSNTKFYGKIIKANNDWRTNDGSGIILTDLHDDNYGYIFSINNPASPVSEYSFGVVLCDDIDLTGWPVSMPIHFDDELLKIYLSGSTVEVAIVTTAAEVMTVGDTLFVSCPISDLIGDSDFGTWPNDIRYLNVSAQTMHLHVISLTETHFYMADNTKSGHAYYNYPISEWVSSPTAPNTPPVLTSPTVTYLSGPDESEIEVTYTDMDENPPEYVRVEVAASREIVELYKDEVVGPYGWTEGVTYKNSISGYHGFGEAFTFTASDGVDEYTLPAGALAVAEKNLPAWSELVSATPNPFNSACRISAPSGSHVEVFDIRGSLIEKFDISSNEESHIWQPNEEMPTSVYMVMVTAGENRVTKRVVYMK